MIGYYWLVRDSLAGGTRPGGSASVRQPQRGEIVSDLRELAGLNLRRILTLTEQPLPSDTLEQLGIVAFHLPVPDMTAPTPEQLNQAVEFIEQSQTSGYGVYVHCLMGMGRTGTVMAAYLVRTGYSAEAAIERIRALRPLSIVNREQERAVEDFARNRSWII